MLPQAADVRVDVPVLGLVLPDVPNQVSATEHGRRIAGELAKKAERNRRNPLHAAPVDRDGARLQIYLHRSHAKDIRLAAESRPPSEVGLDPLVEVFKVRQRLREKMVRPMLGG